MTGAGFDEAYTLSAVEPELADAFRPWGGGAALATGTAVLRRGRPVASERRAEPLGLSADERDALQSGDRAFRDREGLSPPGRRAAGREARARDHLRRRLPRAEGRRRGPGRGRVAPGAELSVEPTKGDLLDAARSGGMLLGGAPLCLFGELSEAGREKFELRGATSVAELDLGVLVGAARMVATTRPLSSYPPVARDLNIVFDESVRWANIETIVRGEGGELLESITFQDDSYRDAAQLGEGKKSVVFRLQLRSMEGTLTGEAADAVVERVVAKLGAELGGALRA